jgi:molecular chaperone DnaK
MKKEAEVYAEDDKKKKESVELTNQAEAVIFSTEKMLKESAEKMKSEDKVELEKELAELKKAKEANDLEGIKKQLEAVNQVAQKIGAAMYEQAAAEAKPEDKKADDEKKADSDEAVVEGEVEEKK